MSKLLTAEDRRRLAVAHNLSEQYLYQCLSGRRDMEPAQARELEEASAGELRRWSLRQSDWYRIWPDLVGVDGAPEVTDSAKA